MWFYVVECGSLWLNVGFMLLNVVEYGSMWVNVVECGFMWLNVVELL